MDSRSIEDRDCDSTTSCATVEYDFALSFSFHGVSSFFVRVKAKVRYSSKLRGMASRPRAVSRSSVLSSIIHYLCAEWGKSLD